MHRCQVAAWLLLPLDPIFSFDRAHGCRTGSRTLRKTPACVWSSKGREVKTHLHMMVHALPSLDGAMSKYRDTSSA